MAKPKHVQGIPQTQNSEKKSNKVSKGTLSLKPLKKKKSTQGFGLGKCPVCWDELGTNTRLLASTVCGHVYCLHCLQQSLKRRKQCPTCRGSLKGTSAFQPLYLDPEEEQNPGERPKEIEQPHKLEPSSTDDGVRTEITVID